MKGILANDKCYSTIGHDLMFNTVGRAFNTDGQIRKEIDVEQARQAFAFTIEKKPSYTQDGRVIKGHYHLRRDDDDSVLPTRSVGNTFQPVQHLQVFDYVVNDIMPQVPELKLETVGTMHGGATGVVMAKFGEDFSIKGDKSPHSSRLFFFNANGRSSVTMGFTNVRLFCQNQLRAAISSASGDGFRERHTTNVGLRIDKAVESIYAQVGAAKHLRLREERLADIGADLNDLVKVLDILYPLNRHEPESVGWTRMNNIREEIVRQFVDGETAQSFEIDSAAKLLNACTYTVYNPRSIGAGTDLAQNAYSGMVGSRAEKALKMLEVVEKVCAA